MLRGFFYRLGVSIKEAGERAGHKRRFYAGAAVRLGLAIRNSAMRAGPRRAARGGPPWKGAPIY